MYDRTSTYRSVNAPAREQTYSYDNSRPFSVFALAGAAMMGVLGLTWGAHAALTEAADKQRIAPPPDLKKLVKQVGDAAETLAQGATPARERPSSRGHDRAAVTAP